MPAATFIVIDPPSNTPQHHRLRPSAQRPAAQTVSPARPLLITQRCHDDPPIEHTLTTGEAVVHDDDWDFGDNWEHVVEFERLLALDPAPRAASCIDGAHARPLEDVGSVTGYARFLDVIADPDNLEHRDTKRWAGGHFDPDLFILLLIDSK